MAAHVDLLPIACKLAVQPERAPQYSTEVKNLAGEKITLSDPDANRALVALMDMEAQLGGAASHYGGPAAFADLMSALHALMFSEASKAKVPWYELFHFVNDAGHCENGLYALKANYGWAGLDLEKLKGFRSLGSPLTGHGEVHLFPEGVYVSNGPLGSGLPQAQGLAVADGLQQKARITVAAISDGGCMEGEAKEAMAAIAGLASKGKLAPFICIVSDNNTKLSGRIDLDSFDMQPTFKAFEALGWKVVHLDDGHDLQKCYTTLESAVLEVRKNSKQPIMIHAKTQKGKGNAKAVSSSTGAHGFPLKASSELSEFLKEIMGGKSVPQEFSEWIQDLTQKESKLKAEKKPDTEKREKIQNGVSQALIDARKKSLPIFSVSADLAGSTGLKAFQSEFPEATLDVGVAESNMVSTAIGLSKAGFIPVVDTFAQFGATKGALPLIMSQLSEGPMIGVFSHTGFQDAADGASHQAITYLSMLGNIPHIDVYALSCRDEAYHLVLEACETFAETRRKGLVPRSSIFFLGRENYPAHFSSTTKYKLGEPQVVREIKKNGGKLITLVAAGSMLDEAMKAASLLEKEGIEAQVVNPSQINHFSAKAYQSILEKTDGRVLTVEDHRVDGGMGAWLAHTLALAKIKFEMVSLGVKDEFGQSAYEALDLYKQHGMDSEAIAKAAQKLAK